MKKSDGTESFHSIKHIEAGILNVGYVDEGPVNGPVVMLLHGWPYDIHSFTEVAPLLVARGYRVIVPYLRGFGSTFFIDDKTIRSGQQSAMAEDIVDLMDALHIGNAILAGFDWGGRAAQIVAALWPKRCKALVSVSGYTIINTSANLNPLAPKTEETWWYQYYFATERGKRGYSTNLIDFNKLIWKNASPRWEFDEGTYNRTAEAFKNPDHVGIVIHNYRWRLSLVPGDERYRDHEKRLDKNEFITVPTITIASDFDRELADGSSYADKFTGKYSHRVLSGIGHNVPQEAPEAFAHAIFEVDSY
ncbi:MAG: alpha/beta hydrolase [Sediminicola sp.]